MGACLCPVRRAPKVNEYTRTLMRLNKMIYTMGPWPDVAWWTTGDAALRGLVYKMGQGLHGHTKLGPK